MVWLIRRAALCWAIGPLRHYNSNDGDLLICRDRAPEAQPQMQPLTAQQQQVALPFAERSFSHLDLTSQV